MERKNDFYEIYSENFQFDFEILEKERKKAISINPDYKPAIDLMNKLQNELI